MKVLILGSGGREHAILATLLRTSRVPLDLFCIPGNAGISQIACSIAIPLSDHQAILKFVESERIDLTFVGPEAPLAAGIVDEFQNRGFKVAGPCASAARLEASKVFAKDFMARHGVPTAHYRVVNRRAEALEILNSGEFGDELSSVVIKADGLAAGKGVVVARSRGEALQAVEAMFSGELVTADAAHSLVIEAALEGIEVSLLVFSDGTNFQIMPPARDHKRVGENDTGPNTGGMGAVSDDSLLSEGLLDRIQDEIIRPTLMGAAAEGFPFCGVLFVGLMITREGPRVLEYNVRFGDPETQAILVRLQTDLFEIFNAIAEHRLASVPVSWSHDSSCCVVLASRGYPATYQTGFPISGIEEAQRVPNVQVFHAGTTRSDSGELLTAGGRVLGITATGKNLSEALTTCYAAIGKVHWEGMQYRKDIGKAKGEAAT